MRKNERPNKIIDDVLYVYNLDAIPINYASETEWRRRGYKIKKGCRTAGYVEYWQGQEYLRFDLYSKEQTVEIKGKKAEMRRKNTDAAAQ